MTGTGVARVWTGALVLLMLPPLAFTARAARHQEIDAALERAREYLYQQQKDGTWENSSRRQGEPDSNNNVDGGQWGGTTALATYALLASGENPRDPRLSPAIDFLKDANITGTYALALRMQVWLLLPRTSETRNLMKKDAVALRNIMHKDGKYKGLFDYAARGSTYSLSRSQYGVLGMWAAAQMGIEPSSDFWRIIEEAWIEQQKPDGGWAYKDSGYPETPGITAVGVATLFITQDYLHASQGAGCNGNVSSPAIERGMKWMVDHFDQVASDESYSRDFPLATLYAVERIGVASGLKQFGGIDWYDKGSTWLLKVQKSDGSWTDSTFISRVANTSFAMLFLTRGRAPLAFNKLDYTDVSENAGREPEAQWNQRPRDVANATRFISSAIERDLNWQIVPLDAPPGDLLEAPVLYVSGKNLWTPTAEQKAKLKAYLEAGGMILANADCAGRGFANGIRKVFEELFPAYAFRELPADHPIYTEQQFNRARWRIRPSVLGLSNGVRELVLLVPTGDLSRTWQLNAPGGGEYWQLAADVFQYAVDKRNLHLRGESHLVESDPKIKPERTIAIARLQYDGNWDPEPGGWRRLSAVMHNQFSADLDCTPVKLGSGALPATAARIAHLTGTQELPDDAMALAEMKKFIDGGGTLIIDSAGGSSEFATSAEHLLEQLFPGIKPQRLLLDDPAYAPPGIPALKETAFRPYARTRLGTSDAGPRVQAYRAGGRIACFYSREDLSGGLVGEPVDGILGYDPASATQIMARLILSSAAKP